MYLLGINEETGLIKLDINNDGWLAIKEFKALYDKHGLEGMTLVALSVDYLSPLAYYTEEDRPYRAMEEIYNSRKKVKLSDKLFVNAATKYNELQQNDDLEMDALNREIYSKLVEKFKNVINSDKFDQSEIDKLSKYIESHKDRMKKFNETFDKAGTAEKFGVASNGYKLSRIEQDIESRRNSKFVDHEKELENPNKLNLIEEKD